MVFRVEEVGISKMALCLAAVADTFGFTEEKLVEPRHRRVAALPGKHGHVTDNVCSVVLPRSTLGEAVKYVRDQWSAMLP